MQYKISYIVYVYNAEDTLERCVESLLYGKERSIDIILAEDNSQDESHMICEKYAERFDCVTYISNKKHEGRAYTRNQALQLVKGKYIIFVESKDWACREYGFLLGNIADQYPENLVVSGFRTTPGLFGYEKDWLFNEGMMSVMESEDYFSLAEKELLQKLWNKVFQAEIIQLYNLQFDENSGEYSDFYFILDYICIAGCKQYVLLDRPLYTCTVDIDPIFDGWESLVKFAEESEGYRRLKNILSESSESDNAQYLDALRLLRQRYIRCIMCDSKMSGKEKKLCLDEILKDGINFEYYVKGLKEFLLENLKRKKRMFSREREKKKKARREKLNNRVIHRVRKELRTSDFTIISQNCIGGVFYHDMEMQFLSPTINMFFAASDFLKFVLALPDYINKELIVYWGIDYPIGELGDIKIHFMHYSTCREAIEAWERRKKRINYESILVMATDRDGFSDTEFKIWQGLPYKKVLFTVNRKYKGNGVVYYPRSRKYKCIPDLIFAREFYKGGILLREVNHIKKI